MKTLSASLKELFEIQAGLDSEINKKHPLQEGENRLEKKETALLVELGEMMNEVREFKFWSTDQKRRVNVKCRNCGGEGFVWYGNFKKDCFECDEKNECDYVLKELVDGLHFILSIGLELPEIHPIFIEQVCEEAKPVVYDYQTIEGHFIALIQMDWRADEYERGLDYFLGFCEKLGYTWDQVAAAYLEKNQENHRRLQRGY